eukprot:TRINITY_DN106688_c0_g1_i1.p1 TRINITY_DN106688_c0_g1~~TRINITY_DN106688_c0_g1_i1.p1  ORF type:complete len:227 (-),score=44.20 TRINITY_DN106688_c0_g1_i1:47-685(-)
MAAVFVATPQALLPQRFSWDVPATEFARAYPAPKLALGMQGGTGCCHRGGLLFLGISACARPLKRTSGRSGRSAVSRPAPEMPGLSKPYKSAIDVDEFLGNAGDNVFKFTDVDGDDVRLVRETQDVEVFVNGDSVFKGGLKFQRAGGRLHCGDGYCDVPVSKRDDLQIFLRSCVGAERGDSASSPEVAPEAHLDDDDDEYSWVKSLDKTRTS